MKMRMETTILPTLGGNKVPTAEHPEVEEAVGAGEDREAEVTGGTGTNTTAAATTV